MMDALTTALVPVQRTRYDYGEIKRMRAEGVTITGIAKQIGCSVPTVYNALNSANQDATKVRVTKSRFPSRPLDGERATMPAYDHPALMDGHTIYPASVQRGREKWAIKSGHNTGKIGAEVLKGKWAGFALYTLTLEERATCPHSCLHWRSCYGNKMHWAERMEFGAGLEWRLEREVAALELQHPQGFAIRLHNLGDFYSVEYVGLWRMLLDRHPALHCFGYTARIDKGDGIAVALARLVEEKWERFAVRFSNAPMEVCSTISIEHPYQCPPDAIVCPEQTGKTESCSTCGLCWTTQRRIAFLQH